MTGDLFYALLRVTLSLIGAVSVLILFVQSIGRVREISQSPEARLRMVTIMFVLAGITVLLGLSAVYDWQRPPPADPVLAAIGVAIRAFIAVAGVVLVLTTPKDSA